VRAHATQTMERIHPPRLLGWRKTALYFVKSP
jgi:hypothetical protein